MEKTRSSGLRAATDIDDRLDGRPAEAAVSSDSNGGQLVAGGIVMRATTGDLLITPRRWAAPDTLAFRVKLQRSWSGTSVAYVTASRRTRASRSTRCATTPTGANFRPHLIELSV
jgi:hypothetical protein